MRGWDDRNSPPAQVPDSQAGQNDALWGADGQPSWSQGSEDPKGEAVGVAAADAQTAGRSAVKEESRTTVSDEFKVQVSVKYGQTMVNFRGATVDEVRGQVVEYIGDPTFAPTALGDAVEQLTEALHKAERSAGIYEERPAYNRGGGGGAPRGGAAGGQRNYSNNKPGVPADKVIHEGTLPAPEGSLGENCACNQPLVMAWSTPSSKQGPNYGKSWPVWQCQNRKYDHSVWVRDN